MLPVEFSVALIPSPETSLASPVTLMTLSLADVNSIEFSLPSSRIPYFSEFKVIESVLVSISTLILSSVNSTALSESPVVTLTLSYVPL